jgi:hypothetical protein
MSFKETWPKRDLETDRVNEGNVIEDSVRRDQLKLVYDYIKFHIALYLATPTALALIADAFEVKRSKPFAIGLILSALIFLVAGLSAALFMGRHIIRPWQNDYLIKFEKDAFSTCRVFFHHQLYWIGLLVGVLGLIWAIMTNHST